jgi:hypothetical protein
MAPAKCLVKILPDANRTFHTLYGYIYICYSRPHGSPTRSPKARRSRIEFALSSVTLKNNYMHNAPSLASKAAAARGKSSHKFFKISQKNKIT